MARTPEMTAELNFEATPRELRAGLRDTLGLDPRERPASPFGSVDGMLSHQNADAHNSALFPDEDSAGRALEAGVHKVGQLFALGDDVWETAEYLAAHLIEGCDELARDHPLGPDGITSQEAAWLADRVAEGWAFRVGVAEDAVAGALEADGWTEVERGPAEVADDEANDVDLVMRDPDGDRWTIQVKTGRVGSPDADLVAEVDIENEMAEIRGA
jgi:hypothetical protein